MARPKGTKNKHPSKKRNQHVIANHLIDKKRALEFFRGGNQSTILPIPRRTVGGLRDQVIKVKQCNCKRSSCLKLYCECFASGILCTSACCCVDCRNLDFEGEKMAAKISNEMITKEKNGPSSLMKQNELEKRYPDKILNMRLQALISILDRNAHAFRPRAVNIATASSVVLSQTLSQNVRSATAAASMAANSSSSNYASTSAAIMAKLRQDNKQKKSKVGCNCRKSFCLKKYCECFQAMTYCSAESCRCQDCQNRPGNPKREQLIAKCKKKDEDKDTLSLAALKYDRANNSTTESNVASVNAQVAIERQTVGGVPENIAAIVTTGVAAAGVDIFLPVSSYSQAMKMKNGNIVSEVSFGMVGKQDVGGSGSKDEVNESPDVLFSVARTDQEDTGGGSTIPFAFENEKNETESEKEKRLVLEETKSYFDSLRVLLNTHRTIYHTDHCDETQDDHISCRKSMPWNDFLRDLEEQNLVSSANKVEHESRTGTKINERKVINRDEQNSSNEQTIDESNKVNTEEMNVLNTNSCESISNDSKIVEPDKTLSQAQIILQPEQIPSLDQRPDEVYRDESKSDVAKSCKIHTDRLEEGDVKTGQSKHDEAKTKSKGEKRSHEELARDTIIETSGFVSRFQNAIEKAGEYAKKKFDGIVSELKVSDNDIDWVKGLNSDTQDHERQDNSVRQDRINASPAQDLFGTESLHSDDNLICKEAICTQSTLHQQELDQSSKNRIMPSGRAIKELYILTAQDTAVINELTTMIREKTLSLARKRRRREAALE